MSHMIRKQIYLEAAQDALLKQRAQELGVSEAACVMVDRILVRPSA